MFSSSFLVFKLAFSKIMGPLYHRFSAEDSLVGHEDRGPFCIKYYISLQMRFSN